MPGQLPAHCRVKIPQVWGETRAAHRILGGFGPATPSAALVKGGTGFALSRSGEERYLAFKTILVATDFGPAAISRSIRANAGEPFSCRAPSCPYRQGTFPDRC